MKYIDNLIEQFIKANGIAKCDLNSRQFLREFSNWINERQLMGRNFIFLLNEMNINIEDYTTAEIGKTSFDSIGKNYYTTIITPYVYGFEQNTRLIESEFKVDYQGNPKISNDKGNLELIQRYMMYNPYDEECFKNWDDLHNSGKNIIVGVYGNVSDKDRVQKCALMSYFGYSLFNNYEIEETTINDTYCKVLASNRTK